MNGDGTYTDNMGHRYSGNWLKNKRSGKGTYIYAGNKKDAISNPIREWKSADRSRHPLHNPWYMTLRSLRCWLP